MFFLWWILSFGEMFSPKNSSVKCSFFSKICPKGVLLCVCVCVFLWGSRVAVLMIQGENELHKSGRGLFVRPSFFPSSSEFGAFLGLDVFSLSDPSSGLLLFFNLFLCKLNFFDSVLFHTPSAPGWILAFVVFFMWMDGFFVLKMPALLVGFAVCEYFHVVGFFQGLMLLWMWIWEFFCLFWISRSCCTWMWIAFAGLEIKS